MKKTYLLITLLLLYITVKAQEKVLSVTLDEASMVSNEGDGGLYFSGTRGVNYNFSPRISPHGDCIDVVNGYAFVTWYKGDINTRNLMLSRKNLNVANSNWVTIEFPHRHVGQAGELLRGTGVRGDSHNTAAVGVSTIDGTVHLIYDLHAYRRASTGLANDFFNYSVSQKNIAFAPDEDFVLSNFLPKQNELKPGENYERLTYPFLHRANDGSLIARYRVGGSGNGDILFAHYDGNVWSDNWLFQDGTVPQPNRNSYYGGERFINDKFYAGFSIRYANNNNPNVQTNGYTFNSGLYFASTNGVPSRTSQWFNADGNLINLPIRNNLNPNLDAVQIAQPGDDYGTITNPRTTSDPSWTVTENGSIHFITRVDNINTHYYRGVNDTIFSSNSGGLIPNPNVRGKMFSYRNHVFMVELIRGDINVKSTPEGKDAWKTVYRSSTRTKYNHFNAIVEGDKLYIYLMQNTSNNDPITGSSRPLFFQQLTLSEEDDINPAEVREGLPVQIRTVESTEIGEIAITIEAENYDAGDNEETYFDRTPGNAGGVYRTDDVDIEAQPTASNGHSVYIFEGTEWLQYTFNSEEAGVFDLVLTAANFRRDGSVMEVDLNGTVYRNVPIQVTGDWTVYMPNIINDVTLNEGTNVLRITQRTSQSSTLDKIEFASSGSTLSNDEFELNNIVVYPNPSNGIFNISSPYTNLNYSLTNIQGQLLSNGKVLNKEVNFSNLNRGIYFLQLSSDNKMSVTKIVIN